MISDIAAHSDLGVKELNHRREGRFIWCFLSSAADGRALFSFVVRSAKVTEGCA